LGKKQRKNPTKKRKTEIRWVRSKEGTQRKSKKTEIRWVRSKEGTQRKSEKQKFVG